MNTGLQLCFRSGAIVYESLFTLYEGLKNLHIKQFYGVSFKKMLETLWKYVLSNNSFIASFVKFIWTAAENWCNFFCFNKKNWIESTGFSTTVSTNSLWGNIFMKYKYVSRMFHLPLQFPCNNHYPSKKSDSSFERGSIISQYLI